MITDVDAKDTYTKVCIVVSNYRRLNDQYNVTPRPKKHPISIFSILVIVHGNATQKPAAQLTGGSFGITLVAFSFCFVSCPVAHSPRPLAMAN